METPESDTPEEQEISQHELASQGYEHEEDQLSPQETHTEGHPTPERPSGRQGP